MLAIDYSDDELDAIAELFNRLDLARASLRELPADPIERAKIRAASESAIRSLVARHAIALNGTAAFPRVRFLDPHATILGAFVGADTTASVKIEHPARVEVRALFARSDVVVEQEALPGAAIKRMIARPRAEAEAVLLRDLPLVGSDGPSGRAPFEVTLGLLAATEEALAEGRDPPTGLPEPALDVLYARTASATVIVRRRVGEIVLAERVSWLSAGTLGTWRVEPVGTQPSVTARLVPTQADAMREAVLAAWSAF